MFAPRFRVILKPQQTLADLVRSVELLAIFDRERETSEGLAKALLGAGVQRSLAMKRLLQSAGFEVVGS